MKKVDKKAIIFLLTMLVASLIFMADSLNKELYIAVYWIIFGLFAIITFAYQKDRTRYKTDYIQIMLICLLIYFVVIYLSGLAFGFVKVPYSIKPLKILGNIYIPFICIVIEEILRKTLIKDRANFKSIFFMIIIAFSLIEIFVNSNAYTWTTALGIFEAISLLIVPVISKNVLLTYLTSKCGVYPSLIYHLMIGLYMYFVPIIPDFGVYVSSIVSILFPTAVYLRFSLFLSKEKQTISNSSVKAKFKKILYFPIMMILLVVVLLVSGLFKYTAISIGSGSMSPKINVGDVVVLEKLKDDEFNKIEIGKVLVYHHDSKIIIHRVTKIGKDYYKTKGDHNPVEDDYEINKRDVIGVVKFKIPYIGYPSVWLSEKIG